MIVGCYSMDLYCDNPEAHGGFVKNEPAQFQGATEGGCRRQARKAGWHFTADNRVLCRRCAALVAGKEADRGE